MINSYSFNWGENVKLEVPIEISAQIFQGMNEALIDVTKVMEQVCRNWKAMIEDELWNAFDYRDLPFHFKKLDKSKKEKFLLAYSIINQAKSQQLNFGFHGRLYNLEKGPFLNEENLKELELKSKLFEKYEFLKNHTNTLATYFFHGLAENIYEGPHRLDELAFFLNLGLNPNLARESYPKAPQLLFEICDASGPNKELGLKAIALLIKAGADCTFKNSINKNIFEYLEYRRIAKPKQIEVLKAHVTESHDRNST